MTRAPSPLLLFGVAVIAASAYVLLQAGHEDREHAGPSDPGDAPMREEECEYYKHASQYGPSDTEDFLRLAISYTRVCTTAEGVVEDLLTLDVARQVVPPCPPFGGTSDDGRAGPAELPTTKSVRCG